MTSRAGCLEKQHEDRQEAASQGKEKPTWKEPKDGYFQKGNSWTGKSSHLHHALACFGMAVLRAARDAGRGTVTSGGETSSRREGEVQGGSECDGISQMDQSRRDAL